MYIHIAILSTTAVTTVFKAFREEWFLCSRYVEKRLLE